MSADGLQASVEKMRAEGVGDAAIDTFAHYYEQLREGAIGDAARERDRARRGRCPRSTTCPRATPRSLDTAVVLKLNGGLGTSMGMTGPKSLLEAKRRADLPRHRSSRQVLGLRERFGARLPLVLMNSLRARATTRWRRSRRTRRSSPTCRWTSCRTRCRSSPPTTCSRSTWPADPTLEWCAARPRRPLHRAASPRACSTTLLEHGYRYAFVSNSDNLGAVLDPRILAWVAREELPFAMEVAGRTEADRKGGHIARAARRAASCCARRRRRPRRTSPRCRTSAATATSTRTTCGSTSRRCATRSRRATACSGCRSSSTARRSTRRTPTRTAGRPARDGDGRRHRRVRGRPRAARPAAALRAGQDDQRPARAALGRLRAARGPPRRARARARRRRRSSTSTPTTTSSSATSSRASRPARRRCVACERLTVSRRRDLRARRRRARRGHRGGAGAHRGWRRT